MLASAGAAAVGVALRQGLAGWFAEQLEQENVERLQNKLDVWKESDTGKPVDFTPKEWGR